MSAVIDPAIVRRAAVPPYSVGMPATRPPHFDTVYTQVVRDLAAKWGKSERFVRWHAKAGNITGCRQFGSDWCFTSDADFVLAAKAPSAFDAEAAKRMRERRVQRDERAGLSASP